MLARLTLRKPSFLRADYLMIVSGPSKEPSFSIPTLAPETRRPRLWTRAPLPILTPTLPPCAEQLISVALPSIAKPAEALDPCAGDAALAPPSSLIAGIGDRGVANNETF